MNLIINCKAKRFENEINSKNELLDTLIDYGNTFLPEADQLAQDIYNSGDYKHLISGLDYYYDGERLEAAILYYNLLDEVTKYDDINDVISKIDCFNEAFRKWNLEIEFQIEK